MAETKKVVRSGCDVTASVPFDRGWFVEMARLPADPQRRMVRLNKLHEDFRIAEIERATRYAEVCANGIEALSDMEIAMNLGNTELALAGAVTKCHADLLNARRWLLTIAHEVALIERGDVIPVHCNDTQRRLF